MFRIERFGPVQSALPQLDPAVPLKHPAHRKIMQGAILIFSRYVSVLSAPSCSSFHFLSCQLLFLSLEEERLMQTGGLWCNPGPGKVCGSKSMFCILRVSLDLDAPRPA